MALTEERRAGLMAYCRLSELEPGEEALLEALYDSAVGYMSNAGVALPPEGTPRRAQYDLCVNYLVMDGYDRRDRTDTAARTENPAYRQLLNQLQLTEAANPADLRPEP